MANFIKIKASDIDGGTTNGSDILIGEIVYVAQGLVNGTGDADKWNVMTSAGKSYLFTTTGKSLEWANQVISACTVVPPIFVFALRPIAFKFSNKVRS